MGNSSAAVDAHCRDVLVDSCQPLEHLHGRGGKCAFVYFSTLLRFEMSGEKTFYSFIRPPLLVKNVLCKICLSSMVCSFCYAVTRRVQRGLPPFHRTQASFRCLRFEKVLESILL